MASSFLLDVGIAVGAALLVSLLFYRLRLPMIVGQLVAGMLVGPYGLGLIKDTSAIDFLASFGIVLLLFVIGLELDPRKLSSIGVKIVLLTTVEFLVAFGLGVVSGLFIGLNQVGALFLGSVLGFSSTAIVAKLVSDRSHGENEDFSMIMIVAVLEDMLAVVLLFLTPDLASGSPLAVTEIVLIGAKALFLFAACFGFGRYLGPRIINRVSQHELEIGEIGFLLALSYGFFFGVLSDYLGFSPAIGALLVGLFLPVKHSGYVREKILPLKDAFVVFFFLSMGMLIDASSALSLGPVLAVVMVAAIVGKFAGGMLGSRISKIGTPIVIGAILVPRGEFSLILAKTGVDAGLVGPQLYPVVGLTVLVTALASPIIERFAHAIRSP